MKVAFRKDRSVDWEPFSNKVPIAYLFSIEPKNLRIRIFADEEETYDILETGDPKTTKEGVKYTTFLCLNHEGRKCNITLCNKDNMLAYTMVEFEDILVFYSFVE